MKKAKGTQLNVAEKANAPFPLRLRTLMEKEQMKQKDLAALLNVTRQSINQYCLGLSTPDLDKLCKIARRFGVTADYLLGLSNAERQENDGINRELGLSDAAVSGVKELLNDKHYGYIVPCRLVFSKLVESEHFVEALRWLFRAVDETANYLPYEATEEFYMTDIIAVLDISPGDVAGTYFMRSQNAFAKAIESISDKITLKTLNNPDELFITLLHNLPKEKKWKLSKYIKEQYLSDEYNENLLHTESGEIKKSIKAAKDYLLSEIEK